MTIHLVKQKLADRTPHVVSKPALITSEEAASRLERGFLEELQTGYAKAN